MCVCLCVCVCACVCVCLCVCVCVCVYVLCVCGPIRTLHSPLSFLQVRIKTLSSPSWRGHLKSMDPSLCSRNMI